MTAPYSQPIDEPRPEHGHVHSTSDTTETTVEPFDHGAVSRFNAWFFSTFDRYINHIARRHRQRSTR